MKNEENSILRFVMIVLVAGLFLGVVKRTWFSETFDTSALEAESEAIEQIARVRRASLLTGENIISNISLEKVNLNITSKTEFITLTRIDPALAERIIA
jgi:DNA uptake protein ComE-like DNA-binding protein